MGYATIIGEHLSGEELCGPMRHQYGCTQKVDAHDFGFDKMKKVTASMTSLSKKMSL